jgi:hypothetical protein
MNRFILALVLSAVASVPVATFANTQVNNAKFRCGNQGPYYGRTDGYCLEVDTKGPVHIVNGSIGYIPPGPQFVSVFEDFVGDAVVPDVGSPDGAQGPWVCTNTNQGGGSCLQKADYDDGATELLIDNGNEVGDATLYWGDESNIDSDKGAICIFRLQLQVATAAADSVSWGLIGAQNDIISSTTNNAYFSVTGADLNLDVSSDNNSTDDADNDTTVDLVAATFYEFMVSLSSATGNSATDVGFYYRATLGGDWTELLSGTTFSIGADVALQPFVQVEKTTGTTTPDLLVDYVHCAWERS